MEYTIDSHSAVQMKVTTLSKVLRLDGFLDGVDYITWLILDKSTAQYLLLESMITYHDEYSCTHLTGVES